MTTPKYSFRSKQFVILTTLILTASSLFAFFAPKVFVFEEEPKTEIESSVFFAHPLSGLSDNTVICPNDGSELHEIYLCGASAERLLNTSIPNLQQIIWSKLQDGSCSAAQVNCGKTSPTCTWNQVSTNTQFNVTEGGEYRIYVQYNDNTSERFYFNVYANGLNPNTVVTNIDCGTDGSITINNVPTTYEYSINSGATWQDSNIFTITSVSDYDVQIRRKNDTQGCVFNLDDITVGNNSIDATTTILPISCNAAKGGIQVDINNASSTYVYKISQGGSLINSSGPISASTYTFPDLTAGTYDIEVTLASVSNCTYNATETIPGFVNIQPNVVVTKNIDCTDGIITVTPSGGNAPFEYSLDNGGSFTPFNTPSQATINVSTTGSYTIKLRDASGCEVDANPVSVITEPEIIYTVTPKDISCNGTDDGSLTIDVSNTQGYSITYSIDGGTIFQTSNVFSNLTPNTYTVLIKKEKAGGFCDITTTPVVVNSSPAFTASAAVTQQIDCTNGSAIISTTITAGGTAPFEYSTNGVDFQTGSDLTGLGAGQYTITVKDASGCTATVDQTVNAGSNPSELTFITSNVDCSTGATDVQVTVQNGNSPFTYQITAPTTINAPGDTFNGLAPNTYTFEVTANDGCKIVRNFIVPNPIQFNSNVLVKNNVSCSTGATDGSIEISVDNFNTSFNIVLEDGGGVPTGLGVSGATTSPITISNLWADNYTIRISDGSGTCEKIESATVAAPLSALVVDSFIVNNMNCGMPGSVTIEASGGWGNYTYAVQQPDNTITPSQSNKTVTGLTQAGTHTIRVTDVNGCLLDTTTFDLIDQGGPTSTVDAAASNYCYSTATKGELKIDVTSGDAPYFYSVNNGTPLPITGGTFTLSNLTPEDYIIKVIGNNGCETIVADTKISGQLFALAQITKPLGCGASPDAIIEVTPEEGYAPYTYRVDSGSGYGPATMPFSASTAGGYTFEIIDDKGCTFITETVNVTSSPPMTTSHNISNTACGKEGTGSIELVAQGGTPPFSYSFNGSPFSTQTLYTGLDAVSYTYSIRDALGCEIIDVVAVVGAEAAITADVSSTNISCNPVVPPGGNIWGNTKIENIQNATGLLNIKLKRVSSPAAHAAGTARYWTYRNYQNVDMSLPAHADGFDIRMYWPHHFYVEIEDEKGCIYESDLFEITQPPLPWIQKAETDLDQSCANGASFEVEVGDPVGLVGPFSYRIWPYDENNPPSWRSFEMPAENEAFGEDVDVGGNERDFRVSGLLFGVSYAIVLRDDATGCQRWRGLGVVHSPEAPNNSIDVVSTPQSLTCFSGDDGRVRFTVTGADDTGVTDANGDSDFSGPDGNRTVKWSIRHTSDRGSVHDAHSIASYRQNGVFVGPATGTFNIDLTGLKLAWYVVEIETESTCKSGNRFLVYRPKSRLRLELDQYVSATCNLGAQIAVTAKGGWDNQRYFNIRNKLDQASWHEYEYAYVVDGTDPATLPASEWSADTYKVVTPTAYDGVNNIYQVYVRDGGGCIAGLSTPITITQDAVPVLDNIDVTNRCTSTNEIYDVVATLTNSGTNPVDGAPKYIWDGEVTTTPNVQLGPGNHTLEVRDENGCSVSQNIFIYPQLVAKSKITKTVDCDISGLENGEMLASAYGGSGTFEFTISPIPASYTPGEETNTTGIFDRLAPGVNYVYTVTDVDPQILPAERCPTQDTPLLQLTTPVNPDFIVEPGGSITCNGANDGKIVVSQNPTADNLDVTYEYRIDGGTYQASNIFEGLTPGLHDVEIRSSKNCVQTITGINISEPSLLQLGTPTVTPFTCSSDNSLGMATITASAGTTGRGPYVYSFNGSSYSTSATYDIPYLTTARTVTVDVIDSSNCTAQTTVTVPAATKVVATIETGILSGPMNCTDDEVISIIGSGGSGLGNYDVIELPSGNLINGTGNGPVTLPAGNPGTYSYELTDNNTGCTSKVSYTIAPFDTIEVSAIKLNDIYCFGGSDGGLEFTVSGYTGAFDYDIYNTNAPTVSVVNGTDNTSSGSTQVTTLPVGTYFVEVNAIDIPKCTAETENVTIQSPVKVMDFTFTQTQELTCVPGDDAQITATPEGGWGGFEFQLIDTANPGTPIQIFDSNNVFSGLTSGINYELTLRDVRGCSNVIKPFTIAPIDIIIIDPATIVVTNPDCPGADNGSISVIATRANEPVVNVYQYILNNVTTGISSVPQFTNSFAGLVQGDYTVTVTDGYGCDTTTATLSVVDPATLEIDAAITQEPNCTPNSGEITVSATGGSGSYEFSIIAPAAHVTGWSAQTVYSTLAPGTYEFSVRDATTPACISPLTVIRTINVVEDLVVTVDDSNTIINCNGESDAVLVATSTGGLGGYQYQLELNGSLIGTPQNSGVFENLGPGSYRIRATGSGNCEDYNDSSIVITEPPLLTANLGTVEDVQCFGEMNGSIAISASGGVTPYQYIISSSPQKAQNSDVFEGLDGGTYSVIIQDASGCEFSIDNIIVNAPTAALATNVVRVEDEECSTDNNGLIELAISGGTAPYEYNLTALNDPSTSISGSTLLLDNLDGGFYNIYIKDANGCYDLVVQEVKVGVDLTASYETLYECKDGVPFQTTTVTLENEDLNSEVLYALDSEDPAAAQTSSVFENITPGTHYISIIHQGGCIERLDTIEIEAPAPLTITSLEGTFNEILVEANGGDGSYTYYFEDKPSSSGSHFINKDGNYLVRVIDGKGCEASIEVPMEFIDIEIPNFITPDGDGYKDTWVIKNWEAFPDIYVRIYDRYGRTIKEFVGQGEWDGSYNQTDLPTGDYWYVIRLNGPTDKREFVGNMTVYR
ncbi:MAG: T9SS type B sorting domain-containing protein [Maribacter sp.]